MVDGAARIAAEGYCCHVGLEIPAQRPPETSPKVARICCDVLVHCSISFFVRTIVKQHDQHRYFHVKSVNTIMHFNIKKVKF